MRLLHLIFSSLLFIAALGASALTDVPLRSGLIFVCILFAIYSISMIVLTALDARNEFIERVTLWMEEFRKLDDEGRQAVAFAFPTIRYKMKRGVVRKVFENTNVPMETFRLFLKTSNDKYISPERDWFTKEMPHWAWLEIYQYLSDRKYIFPGSASGNISHQWKGESYRHLMAYWIGHEIVDMSGDGPLPHSENVPEEA